MPYSLDAGLLVSVQMLFNMPQGGMFAPKGLIYKAIYSLSPPGLFYKDPPLSDAAHFTINDDLDQPSTCPAWSDEFNAFNPSQLEEGLCVVVDVRTLRVEKPRDAKADPKIFIEPTNVRKSYWTILPLAKEKLFGQGYSYVMQGAFQLPLLEGPVQSDILSSPVAIREIYARLGPSAKGNALKLVPGASVIVRVMNPLLKSVFEKDSTSWKSNINTMYLERFVSAAKAKIDQFKFDPKKMASIKSTLAQVTK